MTNLFTSNSSHPSSDPKQTPQKSPEKRPRKPPKRYFKKAWYRRSGDILGAVAVVALLELGLHIGIDKFQIAGLSGAKEQQGPLLRTNVIDEAIEKAEKADVLNVAVIGSSIGDGIDTEQLSKQLNNSPVEYFKLIGGDSRGTSIMLRDIVLPNLQANWVVYMVSPHDANALSAVEERNVSIPGIDAYAKNRYTYKLSRKVETNLYLFRFRKEIIQIFPSVNSLRQLMKGRSPAQPAAAPPAPYEFASYTAFEEADRFKGDLEYIYQLSRENNAQLAIVAIPTNPDPDVTSQDFRQAADVWLQSVQDFADQRNLIVIDGFEMIDKPSQYRDTHHLSQDGIPIITEALGEAIQATDSK